MKEYKGIMWNGSNRSLCIALNKSECAFASYQHTHPNATQENYIDFCLGDVDKKEYRGIKWIDGNYSDLCRSLKRPCTGFSCYKRNHPDATPEDYIDFCLDGSVKIYPDIFTMDKKDEKKLKEMLDKYGEKIIMKKIAEITS